MAGAAKAIGARIAARTAAEAATPGAATGLSELTNGVATGFREHALERMAERVVSLFDIVDAVNNPMRITPWEINAAGKWSAKYIGNTATAVLNAEGEVVTVWSMVAR